MPLDGGVTDVVADEEEAEGRRRRVVLTSVRRPANASEPFSAGLRSIL